MSFIAREYTYVPTVPRKRKSKNPNNIQPAEHDEPTETGAPPIAAAQLNLAMIDKSAIREAEVSHEDNEDRDLSTFEEIFRAKSPLHKNTVIGIDRVKGSKFMASEDLGTGNNPIRLEEDESDSSSLSYNRSRSSSISSTFGPQDQSPISSRMSSSQSLPNSKDNSYTKKTALEENELFCATPGGDTFDEVGGAVGEGVDVSGDSQLEPEVDDHQSQHRDSYTADPMTMAKENHSRHSSDMNDTNDDAAQRRSSRPVEDQIPWPSQRHTRENCVLPSGNDSRRR
ncbi:hypothetical protein F5884DRAFT_337557 [Xylogone sp. PMI_703]|nr:hypothetical protein F5884DRAFT_337557 [Xylogone sp. PMI_703]